MLELMLKLLTYEPYEKVSGNEKDYIDKVLSEKITSDTVVTNKEYIIYDELFRGFMGFLNYSSKGILWKSIQWDFLGWLRDWKNKYYPVNDGMIDDRAIYPVLFKKICFFILVEAYKGDSKKKYTEMSDKEFIQAVGLRENIFNKWHISPRYRKKVNRDSYSSITLSRNGKKQPYLTTAIKRVYYEAGRQEAEENLIDSDTTTEWVAPKLNQLPQFIDVFSGTGTVAASVGANKSVVNDIDVGAACFLYSMSHDSKEVRQRLAQLHNNFVSKDLSEGQELYTAEQWQRHRESKAYEEYLGNQKFEELMVRLRNNYVYIYKKYVQATREVALDFDNDTTKNIEMFYDIGVAWLFLNSFKQKLKKANQFNAIDMDIEAYKKYLHTVLMVKYKDDKKYEKYHQQDESDATFLEKYRIKKSQVKFEKGIKYMDSLKNTIVKNEDFYTVIQGYSGGFIYLDSPYFLTTDYTVPFQDEEHKDMLDILRYADFNWLFSMQYKEIDTDKFNKSEFTKNRKSYQEAGHPLIKNYDYYYNGFVKPFVIKSEMNLLYYETDASKNIEDNNLWVLFFYYKFNNKEMMICNFDSRRNIPYAFEGDKEIGHHIEIMPYNEFLTHLRNRKESSYNELRTEAHNWRKNNIIENYASGARV
jgi:hypothetical protein